jgi:ketosteroid isomerase-like protein
MSQENADALKQAIAAAGDRPEEFFAIFDEDVVWVPSGRLPVGTIYGRDGVREFFRRWVGTWEDYSWETKECIDAGSSAYTHIHMRGRGKTSGVEAENDVWNVWLFFQGKVVRVMYFESREQALEAAGLRE